MLSVKEFVVMSKNNIFLCFMLFHVKIVLYLCRIFSTLLENLLCTLSVVPYNFSLINLCKECIHSKVENTHYEQNTLYLINERKWI